ncbi:Protein of unknown function [Gryllus bimaculatus]|nr:Protein of unknown function [Gryllus bimaculatus]
MYKARGQCGRAAARRRSRSTARRRRRASRRRASRRGRSSCRMTSRPPPSTCSTCCSSAPATTTIWVRVCACVCLRVRICVCTYECVHARACVNETEKERRGDKNHTISIEMSLLQLGRGPADRGVWMEIALAGVVPSEGVPAGAHHVVYDALRHRRPVRREDGGVEAHQRQVDLLQGPHTAV